MSSTAPRDSTAFEVREALHQDGCPVCRLAVRSVGRWLASVAYAQINDIELRTQLRAARGFCNVHAHRWLNEVHNVLGTAILYQDVLTAALREGDGEPAHRGRRWRSILGAQATDTKDCLACRAQEEAEERYLTALLATAAADPNALKGSDGVCLRHMRAGQRHGGAGAERIAQQTRAAIEHLLAELAEVVRKEDYRFRHEPRTDAERTATSRAVARVAGADGLVDT